MTALAPRLDVVCLHLLKLKLFAADSTLVMLLLIGCQGVAPIECTDGQGTLRASKQVLINAGFLCHILIAKKRLHFKFKLLRVSVCSLTMFVIEQAPSQTLHLLAPLREDSFNPLNHRTEVAP